MPTTKPAKARRELADDTSPPTTREALAAQTAAAPTLENVDRIEARTACQVLEFGHGAGRNDYIWRSFRPYSYYICALASLPLINKPSVTTGNLENLLDALDLHPVWLRWDDVVSMM